MSKKRIKTVKIEVNQETANYIQSVSMEVSSRQTLLNTISQLQGVNSPAFSDYQKEFFTFDGEFQLIKERLQEIYIPESLRNAGINWDLDFQTNLITITPTSAKGLELINSGTLSYEPNFEDDIIDTFDDEDEEELIVSGCKC